MPKNSTVELANSEKGKANNVDFERVQFHATLFC